MKFSLIAAIALFALAQGSFAQDATAELERFSQLFEDMKNKMVQDLTRLMSDQDLATQAQTFMEEKKAQLQPLMSQMQEQLRIVATNVEEQIKPLAANAQAQLQVDSFKKQIEDIFQKLTEPARAVAN